MKLTRWRDLQVLADIACRDYELRPRRIEPMTDQRCKSFGHCDANGVIKIRVHVFGKPHRPLKWATIVDTLAHELAHTDETGWRHGEEHRELSEVIMDCWKKDKRAKKLLKG